VIGDFNKNNKFYLTLGNDNYDPKDISMASLLIVEP
jgi:hypothetical protein